MTQELIDFIVDYVKQSDDRAMEFLNILWDEDYEKIHSISKFNNVCEHYHLTPLDIALAVLEGETDPNEERNYFQFNYDMTEVHFMEDIEDDDDTWESALRHWMEDGEPEDFCKEFGIAHIFLVRRFKEFANEEFGAVDGGKLDKAVEYTIKEFFECPWDLLFEDLYA